MFKVTKLRVLSGKFKGAVLKSPQSAATHPMGSREKLALFNMLQPYLEGAKVLDAYAGTGALGIEALSRGASSVTFIESNPKAYQAISDNIVSAVSCDEKKGASGQCEVAVRPEPVAALVQKNYYREKFDIVIGDPPYNNFDPNEIVMLVECTKPGGIFALSMPSKLPALQLMGFELLTDRKYAAARIVIYQKSQ